MLRLEAAVRHPTIGLHYCKLCRRQDEERRVGWWCNMRIFIAADFLNAIVKEGQKNKERERQVITQTSIDVKIARALSRDDNAPRDNEQTGDNDEQNRFTDYSRDTLGKQWLASCVTRFVRVPDLRISSA